METLRVLWLFTGKQWLALRYHWKYFIILLPACLGLQFMILHFVYQPIESLRVDESAEVIKDLATGCLFQMDSSHVGSFYSPNSTKVNQIMDHMCGPDVFDQGFNQLPLMIKYIQACKDECYGVYFHEDENGTSSSSIMTYTIYTNSMKLSTDQRYITDSLQPAFSQSHSYQKFLELQHSIDVALIELKEGNREDTLVSIGAMHSIRGGYFHNETGIQMKASLCLFLIIILVVTFIVPLVEEKEDGVKEFLIITTPLAYLNGLAFYIVHYIIYLVYGSVIIFLMITYQCLGVVPIIHGVIIYVLYLTAMMSYSYLLSVCFQKVFYAKAFGVLLHFMPSMIFGMLPLNLSRIGPYLFCSDTFEEAWDLTQIISNKYETFEWKDVFSTIVEDKFSLGTYYIILFVQNFMYLILYYYFESIFPGPGGIKQPYLFFLQKEFWKKKAADNESRHITECDAEHSTCAIIIQNLVKEFNISSEHKITIADNLNMRIRNNEITVLLGHNGAGKTTIINMIMGLINQDKGEITVCSEGNISLYRHSIGYCPQHSIYMQYMTCKQHLTFFARLRGLSATNAKLLANQLLNDLKLSHKASEYGKQLSGGMKRRLSLGMAIAGKTKVVILDEPSSGLDIESRRELWDVLLELRKSKAILITTHHMEEAEVLGDTISILSNGKLQMSGTPLELKRKVGSGYILKLCVDQNQFNLDNCLEEIRQFIPNARLTNILPSTISISLPYENRETYHTLLSYLENQQRQLAITTISMTDTTLEDVFLNSAKMSDEVDATEADHGDVPYQRIDIQYSISSWQQFKAIAYKKGIFLLNNYWLTLLMFLLPFIFITTAILTIQTSAFEVYGDGLDLRLNHYEDGIVYVSRKSDHSNPRVEKVTELLKEEIQRQQKQIRIFDLEINPGKDVVTELMNIMRQDFFDFQRNVIGSIYIDDGSSSEHGKISLVLYHSVNMVHSSAILLNVIDNTIAQWSSAGGEPQTPIHTIYAPLALNDSSADSLRLVYYAALATTGMFLLMMFFIVLPFRENRSGFKRLQPLSATALWCYTLLCDMILLLMLCLLLFVYQLIIMPSYLYDVNNLITIMLALFFYCTTYLPLIYCLSNAFTSFSAISSIMSVIFISSVIPSIILSMTVGDMLRYENYILFLRLMPDFNLIHQLNIINELFVINHIPQIPVHVRSLLNSKSVLNLGTFYIYVAIMFTLLMLILLTVVENRANRERFVDFLKCKRRINKSQQCPTPNKQEDRLVQEERMAVEKIIRDGDQSEHPLIVRNLYKYYKPAPAVNGLSFVVHKKECFGLLGVNGAGKTTTFEMIAANNTISAGSIMIEGIDQQLKRKQYLYQFGYCPQEDCLNDFMTSYQTLKFMALLRGVTATDTTSSSSSNCCNANKNILEDEIDYWMERLHLKKYRGIQVRHYSGGTKRKLQTATAMIGSPWLVLLDEPTTGVDPISRRFLWRAMQDFQKRSRTIVLTSHSMDECEYLCNRLAIMADGQFKCLGHVPELKEMYGCGFTMIVQLQASLLADNSVVTTITDHLREHFPDSILRENHAGILTYFVRTNESLRWSEVFERAEMFLDGVEDMVMEYSINETTLEDIFLRYYNKSANGSFSIEIVE